MSNTIGDSHIIDQPKSLPAAKKCTSEIWIGVCVPISNTCNTNACATAKLLSETIDRYLTMRIVPWHYNKYLSI